MGRRNLPLWLELIPAALWILAIRLFDRGPSIVAAAGRLGERYDRAHDIQED